MVRVHALRTAGMVLCLVALAQAFGLAQARTKSARTHLCIDDDWRFAPDTSVAPAGDAVADWKVLAASGIQNLNIDALPAAVLGNLVNDGWRDARVGGDQFRGRYGLAWFRTNLRDTKTQAAGVRRTLHFESVDDNCVVFVNGKRLLKHEGWDDEFDVDISSAWDPVGVNTLTLLVENTGGTGGIMKPVTMATGTPGAPDSGPSQPGFDDSRWRVVHLPHDFVVEGVFDPKQDPSHGSLAAGAAWYRKRLSVAPNAAHSSLWIDFDGIYRDAVVYLNGQQIANQPSGYIGFRVDISKAAHPGVNVLAVHVNAHKQEGWWYEGGGIYRHVWFSATSSVHVAPWGAYVKCDVQGPETSPNPEARLRIETRVVNDSGETQNVIIKSTVNGPDGSAVLTEQSSAPMGAHSEQVIAQINTVSQARLWSIENPQLYRLHTEVIQNGKEVDSEDTSFGIRTIRFDADKGLFLNGKSVKIKGTCNHQDFAGVGIAMPDSLLYWRIKKLKEMGSNAYRCSHNPPAAELLDACDRLGMVVMDETRHLGDTYSPKTSRGTGYSDLSDLKAMLLRDRNHPSIIMWSMCNEEGLQGTQEGARIFSAMKEVVRQYDTSRPVTCAMNGGWGSGISNVEDLQGGNYNPGSYDEFHKSHPDQPFYGSETASTVSTRGIYQNDPVRGYVSAYDVNFPDWAQTAENAWRPIAEREYVAGGFVWTGFDYKGEPTPYAWPCINSHFGIMDECGFPKDNWFYYKAWWGDKPVVHILPHWNWPGKEGQNVSVWCHSNCDRVELFLNGKSLGSKPMPKYGHLEWSVPYAAGALQARGYNTVGGGAVAARDHVETTGPPAALVLTTDRKTLTADGEDVTMVAVSVVDARGRVVPTADDLVQFTTSGGAAVVAGVGNGDASSHEPDRASQRHAFNGLCMAIVQAGDQTGETILTASAPGLKAASITIRVNRR